jgi:hypothetical protein
MKLALLLLAIAAIAIFRARRDFPPLTPFDDDIDWEGAWRET